MILLLPLAIAAFALLIGWLLWHGPDEQFAMSPFEQALYVLTFNVGTMLAETLKPIGAFLDVVGKAMAEIGDLGLEEDA